MRQMVAMQHPARRLARVKCHCYLGLWRHPDRIAPRVRKVARTNGHDLKDMAVQVHRMGHL